MDVLIVALVIAAFVVGFALYAIRLGLQDPYR